MQSPVGAELDALVDAIAQRLVARFPGIISTPGIPNPGIPNPDGPIGEPDLERPNLPWDPRTSTNADVPPRARIGIAGMELTQSTQYNGAAQFGAAHCAQDARRQGLSLCQRRAQLVRQFDQQPCHRRAHRLLWRSRRLSHRPHARGRYAHRAAAFARPHTVG